jgi:hypothetical protein
MAFRRDARVAETSSSTGTGTIALAGAYDNSYRRFSAVCSVNDTFSYTIVGSDGSWERGVGTYSATNTLTRTTVKQSTNGNAAVSFTATSLTVFMDQPDVEDATHGMAVKNPPDDNDEFTAADSAASFVLKKITWTVIKSTFLSYFNSVTSTLTNKTLNLARVVAPIEKFTVLGAATGTVNYDCNTPVADFYHSTNASANWTINLRGDAGTTLASLLNANEEITVVIRNQNGASAFYPTVFQIDGSAVTPKWAGGSAPAAGNASATDIYTLNVMKLSNTPTYAVFASSSKFA